MPVSYVSTVLNATADEVWAFLRHFGNLADWMPALETGMIEDGGPGDRVGCVRRLIGPGDSVWRERLAGMDDADRAYWYEILESPLPVRRGHGHVRVLPVTDTGQAFVERWCDFSADAADEEAMSKTFTRGIYRPGLEALKKRFG